MNQKQYSQTADYSVFIVWQSGTSELEKARKVLHDNFDVLYDGMHNWDLSYVHENFSRFYGVVAEDNMKSPKGEQVGLGAFNVFIIYDPAPSLGYRYDASGFYKKTNTNFVDIKRKIRSFSPGDFSVHCSDSVSEFKNNFLLLFGASHYKAFIQNSNYFKEVALRIPKTLMMPGEQGWDTEKDFFEFANIICDYLVLKGNVYHNILTGDGDVDILCADIVEFASQLGLKRVGLTDNFFTARFSGVEVLFDLVEVHDNSFDSAWKIDMLHKKVTMEKNYFELDLDNYFFYLLYFSLVQSESIKNKDLLRIKNTAPKIGVLFDTLNERELLKALKGYILNQKYNAKIPKNSNLYVHLDNYAYVHSVSVSILRLSLLKQRVSLFPRKLKLRLKRNNLIYSMVKKSKRLIHFAK